MKMVLILALINISICFANKKNVNNRAMKLSFVEKVGSIASSALIGFGTGPMLQNREDNRALYYAISQGVGFVLLASSMGDCSGKNKSCESSKSNRYDLGLGILITSRILEVVDTTYFIFKEKKIKKLQSYILPKSDGAELGLAYKFD
jgi:hypothetical protein